MNVSCVCTSLNQLHAGGMLKMRLDVGRRHQQNNKKRSTHNLEKSALLGSDDGTRSGNSSSKWSGNEIWPGESGCRYMQHACVELSGTGIAPLVPGASVCGISVGRLDILLLMSGDCSMLFLFGRCLSTMQPTETAHGGPEDPTPNIDYPYPHPRLIGGPTYYIRRLLSARNGYTQL